MKTKWLAIGIILLFVGVAIAPSINQSVVTASQDDDLVEVTTQACGIEGFGDATVKLTREQYQDLEQYLVEFEARLNQTTTKEEAVPLFKEAIGELDKYGLLPKGMSVKQAQHLFIGWNQNQYHRVLKQQQEIFPNYSNVFCLLTMSAVRNPDAYYPGFLIIGLDYVIGNLLYLLFYKFGLENLGEIFYLLIMSLFFFPLKLMNLVIIIGYDMNIHSFGLKGCESALDIDGCGVLGYTGLVLLSYPEKAYFLGHALAVNFD